MEHCKLQIGCMLIVLYVTFIYIRERHIYRTSRKDRMFEWLLGVGIVGITLDGTTAFTVNHLQTVPGAVNRILHMLFLCSLDAIVFVMFMYILDITLGLPKSRKTQFALLAPLLINLAAVIIFIPELEYRIGVITNYSMGISVYACFVMVAVYMIAAGGLLLLNWRNLERHKKMTISTCLIASVVVTCWQMARPEALITCLVPTIVMIGTYLNVENPVLTKLKRHNSEMVMGFATLVENRDNSTGGHIKRTTDYVRMLAEELKARGFYREQLTKDYIENLVMAAPMHDVGKVAIPDAILQKPGRLTEEEYEIMKTHAECGGRIIQEIFESSGEDEYQKMAYEVAVHHHEKWNGTGYPDGLSRKEIPLCARIMAISDVFDAVAEKRCYRDALPLEQCFQIIEEGSGQDFDPIIAEVFLDMKDKIIRVHEKKNPSQ